MNVFKAPEGIYPRLKPPEVFEIDGMVWFEGRILRAQWVQYWWITEGHSPRCCSQPWQALDKAQTKR